MTLMKSYRLPQLTEVPRFEGDAGRRCGTSMIGNGQGEAEIPLDLAEGVLPTGKA
jgi:hypothetical protein